MLGGEFTAINVVADVKPQPERDAIARRLLAAMAQGETTMTDRQHAATLRAVADKLDPPQKVQIPKASIQDAVDQLQVLGGDWKIQLSIHNNTPRKTVAIDWTIYDKTSGLSHHWTNAHNTLGEALLEWQRSLEAKEPEQTVADAQEALAACEPVGERPF